MFKKNLKQILSSFEKTIAQLESLETRNLTAVSENQESIRQIQAESAELTTEAEQAKRVSDKLKAILA